MKRAQMLQDNEFDCELLDEQFAVLHVQGKKLVVDYSSLMDIVLKMSHTAARMEDIQDHIGPASFNANCCLSKSYN